MTVVPRKPQFEFLLGVVRENDAAIIAEILRPVTIPPEPDPLELRGPSWTKSLMVGGQPVAPPPLEKKALTVRVVRPDGSAIEGAHVTVTRVSDGVVVGSQDTPSDGTVRFEELTGTHHVVATKADQSDSADLDLGGGDTLVTLVLDVPAPPPPGGGGGGGGGGRPPVRLSPPPVLTPRGEAMPAPAPPAPAAAIPPATPVMVFGTLPGVVAAVPATPEGLYTVQLSIGVPIVVRRTDLRVT